MTKKKSQVFILDLIFSFTILIASLGFTVVYLHSPQNDITSNNLNELSLNIMEKITTTHLSQVGSGLDDFRINDLIKDYDYSIAKQIAEYYYLSQDELAINLTKVVTNTYPNELRRISLEIQIENSTDNLTLFRTEPIIKADYFSSSY
jgi:hypothetical protein